LKFARFVFVTAAYLLLTQHIVQQPVSWILNIQQSCTNTGLLLAIVSHKNLTMRFSSKCAVILFKSRI